MANNQDLGKIGEELAQQYLLAQGYIIAHTNWRWGKGELDVVAWLNADKKNLVFIEVKTRQNNRFGNPEDAVTAKKQRLLYELAGEYMHRIGYEGEIRFDIVSIILEPSTEISHFPDAFFPTW